MKNCGCAKFNIADAFKGLPLSLFQGLIGNTMYMQFYEYLRSFFIKNTSSSIATLTSALFSRLMVTTIMIPIESFRVRFTNSSEKLQIKSANSGLMPTLVRDLTYSCMYWLMVEQIRNFLVGREYRSGTQKPSMLYSSVLPAMVSGGIISLATTPIDTLKTRLQSGIHIEGSMFRQLQSIYRK